MNDDVIKSAGLEFFCSTGVMPDMKNNLHCKNSFMDEFNKKKFDYIITNPPYGGDKNEKTDTQIKRTKIKEFIKKDLETLKDKDKIKFRMEQLKLIEKIDKQEKIDSDKLKVSLETSSNRINKFAKKHNLKGNDKESVSLMLMMDMLEVNGTCIGVLKEGVFFNKTYKDVRKCLIENFNVREVISVPSDQFENTATKTSIVIFDNTEEKTTEIKFSELIVDKYTEDKFDEINNYIVLLENKGDIKEVRDNLISSATIDELLQNTIFSLNGKDYNKKEIICSKDYELVKLSNICEFLSKSKRPASFGKKNGKYNFYTSSDKVQKCDIADYKDECIIIGSGGVANIKMDNIFSCSADNFIIKSKYNKYIFNYLKGNMKYLIDGFTGSTLKHISKEYLQNLQIPIPKSEAKIKEWVDKISKPYDEKNIKQDRINELETTVMNTIKDIIENEECDEVEFDNILKYVKKNKKYRASDGSEIGLYKFYTSSQDKILYRNDYEFEKKHILIGRGGVPSLHIATFFSVSHDDVYVLDINNNINNISIDYIYNYLKININYIAVSFKGSTIKHSSKEELSKIKINIPKNKQLIKNLEPLFKEVETLQNDVKIAEETYNKLIKELADDAIITDKKQTSENINIHEIKPKKKKASKTINA